jgi:hypothetical protein
MSFDGEHHGEFTILPMGTREESDYELDDLKLLRSLPVA